MYEFGGFLLAPLTLVFCLSMGAGLCAVFRKKRGAMVLALAAVTVLWVASLPIVAQALVSRLEDEYPALPLAQVPRADAIVVLGGAVIGAQPPRRPSFEIGGASNRVWHAAALYRAGKAPWVVIAAGNVGLEAHDQPEADAIMQMMEQLGVPASHVKAEGTSRNTRENALNTLPIIREIGARRVLLVTSAIHMPRAMETFTKVWIRSGIEIIPATTDISFARRQYGPLAWIPHASALAVVTAAIKEYAGALALSIIHPKQISHVVTDKRHYCRLQQCRHLERSIGLRSGAELA